MCRHLIYLVLLISAPCYYGKLVEWPVTLQNDIRRSGDGRVNGLPLVEPPYHTAGYLELNKTVGARLFYFYTQERERKPDAPVLLWTNGGPGVSSMIGLFMENGPFIIEKDHSLQWREYGWDVGHNVIFLDQPVETGFSEKGDKGDYVKYEDRVGKDALIFLLEFMKLHPELKEQQLFLAGQSYAGHYLPTIAYAIHQSNNKTDSMHLNLKGVLLGNPAISVIQLFNHTPAFALEHKLISQKTAHGLCSQKASCVRNYTECNEQRTKDACVDGFYACYKIFIGSVFDAHPYIDIYDIRKTCPKHNCPDTSLLSAYLNDPNVQAQLGVNRTWEDMNVNVLDNMMGDICIDTTHYLVDLLNEDIRFFIYSGDQDVMANWMGNKALLDDLTWKKSKQWKGKLKTWSIDTKNEGKKAVGECESVEPLTHCTIKDAGHYAPMDQPEVVYKAVRTFITGGAFVTPDPTVAARGPHEDAKEFLAVS